MLLNATPCYSMLNNANQCFKANQLCFTGLDFRWGWSRAALFHRLDPPVPFVPLSPPHPPTSLSAFRLVLSVYRLAGFLAGFASHHAQDVVVLQKIVNK